MGLARYEEYKDSSTLTIGSYLENPNLKINESAKMINPKGSLIIGPFLKTEFFFNAGYGFHSNDARGLLRSDSKVTPLSQSKGKGIGLHNHFLTNVSSNLIFWTLDLESELIFICDT